MLDIIDLDKMYSGQGKVACPYEGKPFTYAVGKTTTTEHGALAVNNSGTYLVCGVCGFKQPIGRD